MKKFIRILILFLFVSLALPFGKVPPVSAGLQPAAQFQQAGVINVLQVYPDGHNTTVVAQAITQWSNLFHIEVLPVTEFNNCASDACLVNVVDPLTSQSSVHAVADYDVLFFGVSDQYGGRDLTPTSAEVVRSFAKRGKGLLFTHDTISTWEPPTQNVYHPNFCSLSDVTGLTCIPPNEGIWNGYFTSVERVSASRDDPVLNTPFVLPDSFPTLQTHYFGQIIAQGTRWYNGSGMNELYMHTYHNSQYGSNSAFYSYGHLEAIPLEWEAKAMINSMYYSYHGTGYSISGRIQHYDDSPIPNVLVSLNSGQTATTDASGAYIFTNLPGGDYTITSALDGYSFDPSQWSLTLQGNASQMDFRGRYQGSMFSIHGMVKDEKGAGIPDVTVSDGAGHAAQTDSGGLYHLANLPAGKYTLVASKAQWLFSPHDVKIPGDQVYDFTGQPAGCSGISLQHNPVFLVTGWSGSAASLSDDTNLKYVKGYLANHGYKESCNLFYAAGTSPKLTLNANGKVLRDDICAMSKRISQIYPSWNGHMDIIGHSYGGLRARAFLEDNDYYTNICPGSPQNTFKPVKVDHLITVGTPHGGDWPNLPLSYLIGIAGTLSLDGPAIYEMIPPVRDSQNSSHWQPNGTSYELIAGDARSQASIFLWPFPTLWQDPNDFAVHQSSAHALSQLPDHYPNIHLMYRLDVHGVADQLPWLYNYTTFFNPSTTFDNCIWPVINNGSINCRNPIITSQQQSPAAEKSLTLRRASSDTPQPVTGGSMMDIQSGALSQGQARSGTFEISEEGEAQVNLAWTSGDVQIRLVDPNGQVVTSSQPGLTTNTQDTGFGKMTFFHFTSAVKGIWSYTLLGSELEEPAVFDLFATLSTPITINSSLAGWYPNAATVPLTAEVIYNSATPVTGGSVSATITRPDGGQDVVILYDDGSHQDGAANDGRFGGQFTGTGQGGIYHINLTALGNYSGTPYKRSLISTFTVAPNSAQFGAAFADQGVDANKNGRMEQLEIQVPVQVNQAGKFTVAADLYAGANLIGKASRTLSLEPGDQAVTLAFDGYSIYNSRQNGPYTLRNLMLLDESQVTLFIAGLDEAYATGPYDYGLFGDWRAYIPTIHR